MELTGECTSCMLASIAAMCRKKNAWTGCEGSGSVQEERGRGEEGKGKRRGWEGRGGREGIGSVRVYRLAILADGRAGATTPDYGLMDIPRFGMYTCWVFQRFDEADIVRDYGQSIRLKKIRQCHGGVLK